MVFYGGVKYILPKMGGGGGNGGDADADEDDVGDDGGGVRWVIRQGAKM